MCCVGFVEKREKSYNKIDILVFFTKEKVYSNLVWRNTNKNEEDVYNMKTQTKDKKDIFFNNRMDMKLLYMVILLTAFGILFLTEFYSWKMDSFYFSRRQIFMAIIGVFMALVISRMNYRTFLKMDYVVVPMMIICMVVFPTTIRRTVNDLWFSIGEIFSIQYSELMELLACRVLADAVSEKRRNMCGTRFLVRYGVLIALLALFGSARSVLIISCIAVIVLFIKKPQFIIWFIAVVWFGLFVVLFINHNLPLRVQVWQDPFGMYDRGGVEIVQSIYAIASGGFFGVGIEDTKLMNCTRNMNYAYITSGIFRKIGWIGIAGFLVVYAYFFWRAIRITTRMNERRGFYMAAVITIRYMVLFGINLLVAVNLLPPTNVRMPFVSYSGTGLIFDFFLLGILLSISRKSPQTVWRQES